MARFERIPWQLFALDHQEIKETFESIEPPVNCRCRQFLLVLMRDEMIDLTPGNLGHAFVFAGGEEELQVKRIIRNRICRIVAGAQMCTKLFDFLWSHAYLLTAWRCSICSMALSYCCRFVAS